MRIGVLGSGMVGNATAGEASLDALRLAGEANLAGKVLGDLSAARATEMLIPVWLRLWGRLQAPMFNFKVVR
jgi:hypothetical protein